MAATVTLSQTSVRRNAAFNSAINSASVLFGFAMQRLHAKLIMTAPPLMRPLVFKFQGVPARGDGGYEVAG
jgi:hypothetical protein